MQRSQRWHGLVGGVCMLLMGSTLGWGEEEGWDAASFVRIGAGARAIALGRAYVSLCGDDPNAVFWNPAGFAWADRMAASGTHRVQENPVFDYSFSAFSGMFPFEKLKLLDGWPGVLGFGFLQYSVEDIDWFTREAIWVGSFKDIEQEVLFSYAYRYGPLALGISVKYLTRNFVSEKELTDCVIPEDSWNRLGWEGGAGVDFGMLLYRRALKLGLMLRDNVGIGNDRTSEDFTFGGSYDRMWNWFGLEVTTAGAAALEQVKHRPMRLHLGAEVRIEDWKGLALSLRGGQSNYPLEPRKADNKEYLVEADTKHQVGFGISWRNMSVDYVYSLGTLDNVGFVSVEYGR